MIMRPLSSNILQRYNGIMTSSRCNRQDLVSKLRGFGAGRQISSTSTSHHTSLSSHQQESNQLLSRKDYARVQIPFSSFQQHRSLVTITKTKVDEGEEVLQNNVNTKVEVTNNNNNSSSSDGVNINSDEGVIVTESCMKRILQLAQKKNVPPSSIYLRVYVDSGGCSGFQYKFEILSYEEEPLEEDDVIFGGDEAKVVVDQSSLELIKGSHIDFVQEMIRSSFVVKDNPMSEQACGCGSSFAVKNFQQNPALD